MKRLTGYVLVKETNLGVPNLVVTIFDSERPTLAIAEGVRGTQDLSLDCVGKRIGSVLTNREGRFVMTAEELEFQGVEARPDLLLVVFAPEDVQDVDHPVPLPAVKRILYISATPMTDAGAEEVLVIRLLAKQLEKFQIPIDQAAERGAADANRLASAMEGTWAFRDNLKDRLGPRILEEKAKDDARKKLAARKVGNLSAIPLYSRDEALRNSTLLIVGRERLKDELKKMQYQSAADGLQRLGRLTPTLHLTLDEADLADLELTTDAAGVTGKVDPATLARKVRSLAKGVDLVRVHGLNNPSPEELEKKYLTGGTQEENETVVG